MKGFAYIRNSMTGKMIPIKLHILAKLMAVRKAERNFHMWNEHWDHTTLEGAETYSSLLDKWDNTAKTFARYANIWYMAQYGLSLN